FAATSSVSRRPADARRLEPRGPWRFAMGQTADAPDARAGGRSRAELQAPDADPAIVVWLARHFAARVRLPAPEGAPGVRRFQGPQLDVVLPWACRLLHIPAPPP